MTEFSVNLLIILSAGVLALAIFAWAYVRVRDVGVKVLEIEFGQAQLRFARKQLDANVAFMQQRQQMGNIGRPGGGPMSH